MDVCARQKQLIAIGTAGAAIVAVACWRRRNRGIRISRIVVYPIKSCRGRSLRKVQITDEGLSHDREYAIVEVSGDKVSAVSQREEPLLSLIVPDMPTERGMIVRKEGMEPLQVPSSSSGVVHQVRSASDIWDEQKVEGEDMGDLAAAWINRALGTSDLRLVRFVGRRSSPEPAKFGEGVTRFSDGFSLLLTSEASLDELSNRCGLANMVERMRPNIVVDGCDKHDEDSWSRLLWTGGVDSVELRLPKPCARCTIPRVNPMTGIPGPDPLRALKGYRSGKILMNDGTSHSAHYENNKGDMFFGQNASPVVSGKAVSISVGDPLTAVNQR